MRPLQSLISLRPRRPLPSLPSLRCPGLLLIVLCLGLSMSMPAVSRAQDPDLAKVKERELEAVREQISTLKKSMDQRALDRDRISGELQAAEVLISEKRIHVGELERQRRFSEKKKLEAETNLHAREAELEREMTLLATQVRTAYISGRQERVKLLLNQRDPATLGRMLTYYRYFSDYRGENIGRVNTIIDDLERLQAQAAEEEQRIAGLARARYAELTELNVAQEERQRLLVSLKSRIAEEGSEVSRLASQEQDLSRLIEELTSILSDFPITSEEPFSKHKGRLTWPIAGGLVHDFGQPRAGGLNWNGVVLSASRGTEVRAVYHGRVAFADWLSGMGLLLIVDHGEGYLTLYGYNETLLKSAGDWVAPGDVIATVGESGGQQQPALYFELRSGRSPVNPRSWFNRKPKS